MNWQLCPLIGSASERDARGGCSSAEVCAVAQPRADAHAPTEQFALVASVGAPSCRDRSPPLQLPEVRAQIEALVILTHDMREHSVGLGRRRPGGLHELPERSLCVRRNIGRNNLKSLPRRHGRPEVRTASLVR